MIELSIQGKNIHSSLNITVFFPNRKICESVVENYHDSLDIGVIFSEPWRGFVKMMNLRRGVTMGNL